MGVARLFLRRPACARSPDPPLASPTRGEILSDMPLDFAITALVTLLVVVDPVGLAPTFLAVTEGLPRRARRDVAVRASLIAGAILIGAALLGDLLLRALGISLSAFRIAGGLLLFAFAFEMVLGVRMRREGQAGAFWAVVWRECNGQASGTDDCGSRSSRRCSFPQS